MPRFFINPTNRHAFGHLHRSRNTDISVSNLEINGAILIFGDSSGLRIVKELRPSDLHMLNAGSNQERIDSITQIHPGLVILNIPFPIRGALEISRTMKSNLVTSHLYFILMDPSSKEMEGLRADDCIVYLFRKKLLSLKVKNIIQSRKISKQWHAQHTLSQPGQDGYWLAGSTMSAKLLPRWVLKTANISAKNMERHLRKHPRKSNAWNIECDHLHRAPV